ncbi:MAG: hypothetical protein JO367_15820 [Actinobacteria bacterium]|nr:hypothetical protein [Actinomycetota bacterium]
MHGLWAPKTMPWDTSSWPDSRLYIVTVVTDPYNGAPSVSRYTAGVYVDTQPPVVTADRPIVQIDGDHVIGPTNVPITVTVNDDVWAYMGGVRFIHLPDLRGCAGQDPFEYGPFGASLTPADLSDTRIGTFELKGIPGGCITDNTLLGVWVVYVTGDDLNYNAGNFVGPFAFTAPPVT